MVHQMIGVCNVGKAFAIARACKLEGVERVRESAGGEDW